MDFIAILTSGFCERSDDIEWWSAVLLTILVFFGVITLRHSVIASSRSHLHKWCRRLSLPLGIAVYVYIICKNPGTFYVAFTDPKYLNSPQAQLVQVIEGLLMLVYMFIGLYFFWDMLFAMCLIRRASPREAKYIVSGGLAMWSAVVALLAIINPFFVFLRGRCDPWWDGSLGLEGVVAYVCLIWWPLLVLLIAWMRAVMLRPGAWLKSTEE